MDISTGCDEKLLDDSGVNSRKSRFAQSIFSIGIPKCLIGIPVCEIAVQKPFEMCLA